jgi:sensor domain CHASE-containing protein
VLGTFEQIEYRQMSISTQDVLAKLDAEVEDLAAFCRLWARSDALYAFMEDEDHRFPPGRIDDPALFRDMKVSYILLYDSSGSLVHAWGYRGDTGPVDAMPQELDRIIRDSIIPPGSGEGISGRRGYALLDGGPVILAGYHIVQPGGEGEPRGTLVMVRTLDQQAIESLAQQGELGISFLSQDSSGTAAFTGSDRAQMEGGPCS